MESIIKKLNEISGKLFLTDQETKRIVIYGEPGVGKTWMAKKLSDHALAVEKDCFDYSIWIFMSRVYEEKDLLETVARQMSIQLEYSDEWEKTDEIGVDNEKEADDDKKGVADDKKDTNKEKEKESEENQLKRSIKEKSEKKKILLVLDDEGSKTKEVLDDEGSKLKEDEIMQRLKEWLDLDKEGTSFKILVTREKYTSSKDTKESSFELKPLVDPQLSFFLQERIDTGVRDLATKERKELNETFGNLFKSLTDHKTQRIVIFGDPGVGKTLMAKKLSDHALALEKDCFDYSIWIFMSGVYEEKDLLETVARQMSIQLEKKSEENLKRSIKEKSEKKKILLVLDDEGSKTKEEEIMPRLVEWLDLHKEGTSFKILVTREKYTSSKDTKESSFELKPLVDPQLSFFLQERIDTGVRDLATKERKEQLNETFGNLFKSLTDHKTQRIVIFGDPGVGKTWMAKKLYHALALEKDCFDYSIWIFMSRVYEEKDLLETVARQMSIQLEKKSEENLKRSIKEKSEKKKILLVLDDEGSKTKEEEIMPRLVEWLDLHKEGTSFKILVTTEKYTSSKDTKESSFELKPLVDTQAAKILKNPVLQERIDAIFLSCKKERIVQDLATKFLAKCKSLPIADIIVVAKALNYFGKDDAGVKLLEKTIEDYDDKYNVMQLLFEGYDLLPRSILFDFLYKGKNHFFRNSGSVHYNELITYWILEGYLGHISSIQKAFEMGHHIVMELIECHMLKELEAGYVIMNVEKRVSDISDWRDKGFHETVIIGLATVFENNKWAGFGRITHKDGVVRTLFKDNEGKNLATLLLDGNYFGVEDLDKFLKFKEVHVLAVFHPTMKELPKSVFGLTKLDVLVLRGCDFLEKFKYAPSFNLTVLEISGAISLTNLPDDFFKDMTQLRSLNLSDLKIESLPSSLFDLKDIRWLILSGCSRLKQVSGTLKNLEKLLHLDLSRASSFESFDDKNFHSNKDLRILDVSKTKIKTLPLLKQLTKLTHLLLTDCADLDRLRSIAPLTSLQTLDISGAIKFKEFHDLSLEMVVKLNTINLSGTSLELLPSHVSHPRQIILKRCLKLKQLECMDALEKLEILDLSGSNQMSKIEDGFFDSSTCLQELNLSETKITSLPSLSKLNNLRQLLLSRCESLQELPELNGLINLEELDASNCTALKVISDQSFEHMPHLQKLNLSNTKIESLPTLPNSSSLLKLLLQNCTNLKKFPSEINLPKLEELNLSGVELSGENRAAFLKDMSCLRILDLSETHLESLPTMSNLKNLNILCVRGCKHLKVVPDLEKLTNLETLDLSGTTVNGLESLSSFKNLRQFHSSTKQFLDLKLNLLGDATTTQLPHGISDLPHLEMLELPSREENKEDDTIESEKTRGDPNRQQWMMSSWPADVEAKSSWPADVEADNDKHGIYVSSARFDELLKDPSLWDTSDTSFKQFHFLVRPLNQLNKKEDYKYLYKMERIFRGTCFQQFVNSAEQIRSLEIRGFQDNPASVDVILQHAAVVYITDNTFITSFSDFGVEPIKKLKVCWIERCNNMKSIFDAEKLHSTTESEENANLMEDDLEFILVSNATNLESIVLGNLHGILKKLKCLHLDCCPKISTLFCVSQQLENLEVLEIKFCDGLKTLFKDGYVQLPKLKSLHLRALPNLEKVGCVAPNLVSLQVVDCPKLVTVLSASTHLTSLHIKCCEKLTSVFEDEQSNSTLSKLQELHLWGLPMMRRIGAKVPDLEDCIIRECQVLEDDLPGTYTK